MRSRLSIDPVSGLGSGFSGGSGFRFQSKTQFDSTGKNWFQFNYKPVENRCLGNFGWSFKLWVECFITLSLYHLGGLAKRCTRFFVFVFFFYEILNHESSFVQCFHRIHNLLILLLMKNESSGR